MVLFRTLHSYNTTLDEDEEEEIIEFMTLLMFLGVIILSQLLVYLSRVSNQTLIPEAGLLLMFGMTIGGLVKLSGDETKVFASIEKLTEFDNNLFFMVLLPPIIFDSGYTLRREVFFGNFIAIMMLAVVGTIVSCFMVGFVLNAFASRGLIYPANLTECLVFGALISATDPVTVIAVFHRIGVKPLLLILVFGESVLNDAVSIVLYQNLVHFANDWSVDTESITTSVVEFCFALFFAVLIGIVLGLFSAVLFKFLSLWRHEMHALESTIVFIFPFISYSLAQGLGLSGIVSMLFTGISMAAYTRHNLSVASANFLSEIFKIFAHISETFIFLYLGMQVFTGDYDRSWEAIKFSFVALFACFVARFVAVVPICMFANLSRDREHGTAGKISWREMFVLWWSGLRGGMAFALAASSTNELDNKAIGPVFETATTFIIFTTVFFCGGSVKCICERMRLLEVMRTPLSSPLPGEDEFITTRVERVNIADLYSRKSSGETTNGDDGMTANEDENGDTTLREIELTELNSDSLEHMTQQEEERRKRMKSKDGMWSRFEKNVLSPLLIRRDTSSSSVMFEETEEATHNDATPNPINNNNNGARRRSTSPGRQRPNDSSNITNTTLDNT